MEPELPRPLPLSHDALPSPSQVCVGRRPGTGRCDRTTENQVRENATFPSGYEVLKQSPEKYRQAIEAYFKN